MADARLQAAWDRTSTLWCVLANANRDPDKHPEQLGPHYVHPFLRPPRPPSIEDLPDDAW